MKTKCFFVCFFILITSFNSLAQNRDTLIVAYNPLPPFVIEKDGGIHGPSAWLWEQIAEEHDIVFKLVKLPLDSLLQAIENGSVDIGISPLTITSERLEKIDFSPPYHIAHSSMIVRKSSTVNNAFDFIGSFFSIDFFKALGALAVIIFIFGFLTWLFEKRKNTKEFGKGLKGLWSGFWWSAVTMTTVGYGDKSPRTIGGRIMALIWMFTAIIIISGLTASITSSLTVNQIDSRTNKMQDFKKKKIGTVEKSATEMWLRDNFYSNRQNYSNIQELISALKNKQIDAIAYDRPLLQSILKQDTVFNFQLLDIKFNPQFYGIGINRNLPANLKHKISVSVMKQTESMDWHVLLSEFDLQ